MDQGDDNQRDRAAPGGMFDAVEWPQQLKAKIIEPSPDPRIHGFATEDDLARHYGFVDLVYLSLTGDWPTPDAARALEVVMIFLAAVPINEGPTHAASVARLCNAPARAVLEVASVALAERGRFI